MGIAITVQQYLDEQGVPYDVLAHTRTRSAAATAEACHVPGNRLAKAVVVKRRTGYILAIVPASRRLEMQQLGTLLDQPVGLATEEEVAEIFDDCDRGAVPPLGAAYGVRAVVDEALDREPDVYFEGGDHCSLVHVSGAQFHRLMEKVPHAPISTAW